MPLGRSRTINAQGRQKSCSECAKAKRKCGLEQPSCARCSRQHLVCAYPQPRSQAATQNATPDALDDFDVPNVSMDFQHVDTTTTLPLDFDITTMPSGSNAELLDYDFLPSTNSLGATIFNTSPDEQDQLALQPIFHNSRKTFISPALLVPFVKTRVEYSVEQLKSVPKMMVEELGTPWAHNKLYEESMPKALQDAHAACALYVTRNESNADYVIRHITSRVEELTNTTHSNAPVELLARAQALLLYLNILGFGADARFFGQAEALMPPLEEIGHAIEALAVQQMDTTGPLPLYPSTAARTAWRSYVFRESVRRTLLSIFHMTTIYNLLRGQAKSCIHTLTYANRVTISAHLWNANNPFDFAVAWNNREHFLVKGMDFTEVLRDAKANDVDLFGRMMLVGLNGVDDMRGWFHTRGGTL